MDAPRVTEADLHPATQGDPKQGPAIREIDNELDPAFCLADPCLHGSFFVVYPKSISDALGVSYRFPREVGSDLERTERGFADEIWGGSTHKPGQG